MFNISLKKNIVFIELFETSVGSDIFASFSNFKCQSTHAVGSNRVHTFEI